MFWSKKKSLVDLKKELEIDLLSLLKEISEIDQHLVSCENEKEYFLKLENHLMVKKFQDSIVKLNESKDKCALVVAKIKDAIRRI